MQKTIAETAASLPRHRGSRACVALGLLSVALGTACVDVVQRDGTAPIRRGYSTAFFWRHNALYRTSAAIHYAHGKVHDVLQLSARENAAATDAAFDADVVARLDDPPWAEPSMMQYGPHVGQAMWRLYNAIDWTHGHHEATYAILSDDKIAWNAKAQVTEEAVSYYLSHLDEARSPAPLELTLRRAGVMMKPYFGYFRNHYPRSAKFFFVAHWWHPAVYEAMMIGGNDAEQDAAVGAVEQQLQTVLQDRPERMLLSREVMPRYARMSPASANIFDNLHMLHGIAYDILAYPEWTLEEKQAEMYRIVTAMSEQPGDRELAARFDVPHADVDPRRYAPWMAGMDGAMSEMMRDMLIEMWPGMSPDGAGEPPPEVLAALRRKMMPGMQPGETAGSFHDELMALVPGLKMDPTSTQPGVTPKMAEQMTSKGRESLTRRAPVAPWPMSDEPALAMTVSP